MNVEHELRDGPLQPRELALQHDEAGSRQLRRCLEIHEAQRLADFEMLLRHEVEYRLRRNVVPFHFLICVRARAVRHIGQGQVRDRFQQFDDGAVEPALSLLALLDDGLELGHLLHQALCRCLVLGALGLADLLRGGVAARLRLLQLRQMLAARLVALQDLGRHRWQAAPGEAPVESILVLADETDVVHGGTSASV